MADKKPAAGEKKKAQPVSDKRRMAYLRIRYGELRKESQAAKKELGELRKKLGAGKKAKAKAGAAAEGDDD